MDNQLIFLLLLNVAVFGGGYLVLKRGETPEAKKEWAEYIKNKTDYSGDESLNKNLRFAVGLTLVRLLLRLIGGR